MMSPEGQQLLARYADRGWFNAAGDTRLREDASRLESVPPRRAYLLFASGMLVSPSCEIQVTTRCNYRPFRGRRLVVAADAKRFDLIDLKIRYRSQFRRDESLPLHCCVDEAMPELIQWPLDICGAGADISVRAIIPARVDGEEEALGATFEMILLGEVI